MINNFTLFFPLCNSVFLYDVYVNYDLLRRTLAKQSAAAVGRPHAG